MRRFRRAFPVAVAAVLTAAACTDSPNPLEPDPIPIGEPGETVTLQALTCTGSMSQREVKCAPPAPNTAAAFGDIIVGNQGIYVTLASSNVAYNGGTGQFTFDVTLQNLIEQPLGTADGTTLDPAGIRIFFFTGPTVTAGTGVAAVVPDGFDTFTALGQAYYAYTGNILVQNETSAAKTWTLIMPPTVETFAFTVLVSAPVQYPNGYITLDGNLPAANYGNLHPGSTEDLVAVSKDAVGTPVVSSITFGTTNAGCATVSPSGTVTGVQAQSCTITATDGVRNGSMIFNVTGTVRTWNGSISTDWSVGGNWNGGLAPVAADSVLIPAAAPLDPALVANTTIQGVQVEDVALIALGAFNLTANANVQTGPTGGITASGGRLILAGTGATFLSGGTVPSVLVSGTYSLSADLVARAEAGADNGLIQVDSFLLQVDAN